MTLQESIAGKLPSASLHLSIIVIFKVHSDPCMADTKINLSVCPFILLDACYNSRGPETIIMNFVQFYEYLSEHNNCHLERTILWRALCEKKFF